MQLAALDHSRDAVLSWTYLKTAHQPLKVTGAALLLLFTICAAALIFHSTLIALGAGATLFLSVAECLLPFTYTLTKDRAQVKCGPFDFLDMPRETIRSVYRIDSSAIKLSAFSSPNTVRMEPYRGIALRFPPELAFQIVEFINREWETEL